jgi:hypothetical protein
VNAAIWESGFLIRVFREPSFAEEAAMAARVIKTFGVLALSCGFVTPASATDIKQVMVNDTPLAYLEAGHGEPLVFVHGGSRTTGSGPGTWRALPRAIGSLRIAGAITIPMR